MPKLTFSAAGTVTGFKYWSKRRQAAARWTAVCSRVWKGFAFAIGTRSLKSRHHSTGAVLTHAHLDIRLSAAARTRRLSRADLRGRRDDRIVHLLASRLCAHHGRDAQNAQRGGTPNTIKRTRFIPRSRTRTEGRFTKFPALTRSRFRRSSLIRPKSQATYSARPVLELTIMENGKKNVRVFSGDGAVGHADSEDSRTPRRCDVLLCESTYGDRDHPADARRMRSPMS